MHIALVRERGMKTPEFKGSDLQPMIGHIGSRPRYPNKFRSLRRRQERYTAECPNLPQLRRNTATPCASKHRCADLRRQWWLGDLRETFQGRVSSIKPANKNGMDGTRWNWHLGRTSRANARRGMDMLRLCLATGRLQDRERGE